MAALDMTPSVAVRLKAIANAVGGRSLILSCTDGQWKISTDPLYIDPLGFIWATTNCSSVVAAIMAMEELIALIKSCRFDHVKYDALVAKYDRR